MSTSATDMGVVDPMAPSWPPGSGSMQFRSTETAGGPHGPQWATKAHQGGPPSWVPPGSVIRVLGGPPGGPGVCLGQGCGHTWVQLGCASGHAHGCSCLPERAGLGARRRGEGDNGGRRSRGGADGQERASEHASDHGGSGAVLSSPRVRGQVVALWRGKRNSSAVLAPAPGPVRIRRARSRPGPQAIKLEVDGRITDPGLPLTHLKKQHYTLGGVQ